MIPIFVINLPNSTDRKKNISEQLNAINVSYEIFPAINGCDPKNADLLSHYDEKKSLQYRGKTLTKGQLGCYASHYLLWEKCIELNQAIVILEDDALIYKTPFIDIINNAAVLAESFDCIRLFDNKRPNFRHKEIKKLTSTSIHKFNKGHMSTTGYFITPKGAKKYLQYSESWAFAVDIFMDRFWVNKVDAYGTYPACLTNDPKFDSDIGYGAKPKRSLICKIKREVFNFSELIHRNYHNLKYHLKKQPYN